jgi:hypothetical protein
MLDAAGESSLQHRSSVLYAKQGERVDAVLMLHVM